MTKLRFRATVVAITITSLLALAATANAHIQVTPSEVAPGDPVLFTVLVPGERDVSTTEVEVQVPKDVLPFSYGDSPGWKRELVKGPDGSVASIKWTGKAAPDGFAEFTFLASTPETEGPLAWKALQTYESGDVVRWIGEPGTELPAAVVTVSADAPRQNAGGEGEGEGGGAEAATPIKAVSGDAGDGAAAEDESDGDNKLALALSIAALLFAFGAFVAAVRTHRR